MIDQEKMNQAINCLEQCLDRMKKKSQNSNGGDWQAGGCYWRLMKVIEFVDSDLDRVQGFFDAERLRSIHGRLVNPNSEVEKRKKFSQFKKLLSTRAQNCLIAEGFITINQVVDAYFENNLSHIPGMGAATVREVVSWAKENFSEASMLP